MRIKKRTATTIRGDVAKLLIENRDYTAKELKKKVEGLGRVKHRFTDRTYLNVKNKLLDDFSDDPKDKTWTIGACVKCDIPADIIPLLILSRIAGIKTGNFLTVRTAQWIAKLYPLALETKTIQAKYANNTAQLVLFLLAVAEQYAKKERVAEMMKEPFPDTQELDELYFLDGNADVHKGFLVAYQPEQYFRDKVAFENFKPMPKQFLEKTLGPLSQAQVDTFNEWGRLLHLAKIEPEKSMSLIKKLLGDHPDLQNLIDLWDESVDP